MCNAQFDFSDLELEYAAGEAQPRHKPRPAAGEKGEKKPKPNDMLPNAEEDLEGLLGCTLHEVKKAFEPVHDDVRSLLEMKNSFQKGIDALEQNKSRSEGEQGAELARAAGPWGPL